MTSPAPLAFLAALCKTHGDSFRVVGMMITGSIFCVSGVVLGILAISEHIQPWWLFSTIRLLSLTLFLDELILTIRPTMLDFKRYVHQQDYPLQLQDAARIGLTLSSGCMMFQSFQAPLDCKNMAGHSNPDIVGSGVRLSMYILLLTVIVSLFAGLFHSGPSGTKELGVATLISMCRLEQIKCGIRTQSR